MTPRQRAREIEARRGGWICFTVGNLLGGFGGWAFSGQPWVGLVIGLGLGAAFGLVVYGRDRPRRNDPYHGYFDE